MRERDIMFETSTHWVGRQRGRYVVFEVHATHSVSDSAYALTPDGLSIAIARAKYLSQRIVCK